GLGVGADEGAGELGAVGEGDGDEGGVAGDVVVRDDVAVGRDDEPRADALHLLAIHAVGGPAAVELVEEVGEGVAVADLPHLDHVDRDDGRRRGLDGPRDGGAARGLDLVAELLKGAPGRRGLDRLRRGDALLGEDGLFAAGEEEREQQEVLHRERRLLRERGYFGVVAGPAAPLRTGAAGGFWGGRRRRERGRAVRVHPGRRGPRRPGAG